MRDPLMTPDMWNLLQRRLTMPIAAFRNEPGAKLVVQTKDGPLIHIDRGSPVLGVAHMDFVLRAKSKPQFNKPKMKVTCGMLDDRLGVWVLLDVLPRLGVEIDVLLTDSEEVSRSTAEHFQPTDRKFNWMFQFDRHGSDTVMYDYEDDALKALLTANHFRTGRGSFSDICKLEHLGCKGFNVGTGYFNEHRPDSHAELRMTLANARVLADFWRSHKDTHLPHTKVERKSHGSYDWSEYEWTSDPKSRTWIRRRRGERLLKEEARRDQRDALRLDMVAKYGSAHWLSDMTDDEFKAYMDLARIATDEGLEDIDDDAFENPPKESKADKLQGTLFDPLGTIVKCSCGLAYNADTFERCPSCKTLSVNNVKS